MDNNLKCPVCETYVEEENKQCPNCGAPLSRLDEEIEFTLDNKPEENKSPSSFPEKESLSSAESKEVSSQEKDKIKKESSEFLPGFESKDEELPPWTKNLREEPKEDKQTSSRQNISPFTEEEFEIELPKKSFELIIPRLSGWLLDFFLITGFWLITILFASRILNISVVNLISSSFLRLIIFYFILLFLYLVLFLSFLKQTVGGLIFPKKRED
ncbi:MAG: zinc ribbon domain-containing protein [Candidatus Aminicenantia bacterium]